MLSECHFQSIAIIVLFLLIYLKEVVHPRLTLPYVGEPISRKVLNISLSLILPNLEVNCFRQGQLCSRHYCVQKNFIIKSCENLKLLGRRSSIAEDGKEGKMGQNLRLLLFLHNAIRQIMELSVVKPWYPCYDQIFTYHKFKIPIPHTNRPGSNVVLDMHRVKYIFGSQNYSINNMNLFSNS